MMYSISTSWYTWIMYLYIVKLMRIIRDTLLTPYRNVVATNCLLNKRNDISGKPKFNIMVTKLGMAK